jgi:hypothetical protein
MGFQAQPGRGASVAGRLIADVGGRASVELDVPLVLALLRRIAAFAEQQLAAPVDLPGDLRDLGPAKHHHRSARFR